VARIIEAISLSVFVALLYLGSRRDQQGVVARVSFLFFTLSVQGFVTGVNAVLSFADYRALLIKEKDGGLYTASAFLVGKSVVDVPLLALTSLFFGSFGYFMVGLKATVQDFCQYVLALFLQGLAVDSVGVIVAALAEEPSVALTLAPLSLVPFMLVSGFFVNIDDLPAHLAWLAYISPHTYIFEAMMNSEFRDIEFSCSETELITAPDLFGGEHSFCPIANGEEVLESFSLNIPKSTFFHNCAVVALLFVGYRVLALVALKFITTRPNYLI